MAHIPPSLGMSSLRLSPSMTYSASFKRAERAQLITLLTMHCTCSSAYYFSSPECLSPDSPYHNASCVRHAAYAQIKTHTSFFLGSCGVALPSRVHLPAYLTIPRCLVSTPYRRRRQILASVIGEQHAITAVVRVVLLYLKLKLFGVALDASCVKDFAIRESLSR